MSAKKDGDSYTVLLPKTLSAGGETSYTAEEIYGNILTLFPEYVLMLSLFQILNTSI